MHHRHRKSPPRSPARVNAQLGAAIAAVLAGAAPLAASAAAAAAGDIDEIIVTATRRDQSVQDIPYNISAIGAADILDSGVTDLQGLTQMIPGLVSPDLGARAGSMNSVLTIRGLNASAVNTQDQNIAAPVVSTYVDETPLFANLKMTDIARVEILRGPQGTLYGSGSLGGTVRMIHNEPDTTRQTFEVATRASHTANAANPSAAIDAIANLPLSDTVAFRASFGYEKQGGFTDAKDVAVLTTGAQPVLATPADPLNSGPVFAGKRGVDWSDTWYARGALLWKASDNLKLEFAYQHQSDQSGGYSQTNPAYRYTQTLYIDQPGSFSTDLGSLDVTLDAGFATISADSSLTSQSSRSEYDLTGLIESLSTYYGNYPRSLSPIYIQSSDKAFTEEVRMVSKNTGPWDWVAGAYYSSRHETLDQIEPILGFGAWSQLPGSGQPAGCTVQSPTCPYPSFGDVIQYYKGGIRPSLDANPDLNFTMDRHVTFSDAALFNETAYHFTDNWQATAGGRIFWQHYDQTLSQTLPMCGPFCSQSGTDPTGLTADSQAKGFRNQIFKLNTSYKVAEHTQIYITWSEGFRRGGVNALPTGPCYYCEDVALLTYKPDEARNTEIGIKGSFGAGTSYTFTLYNIDWSNPQIETNTLLGGFDFVTNGTRARSRGAEAELAMPLSDSTRLELGYSYTDAILTAGFQAGVVPDVRGYSGDRLPGVSKQQVTTALDFRQPLAGDRDVHARLDASYRSDFWSGLPHNSTAEELPGFALVNARAGLGFAQHWRSDLFIDNLTNREAATALSTVPGPAHERALFIGRPRTIGIDFNYKF
jgi:outer membrane receptor protein involved in Fe transport